MAPIIIDLDSIEDAEIDEIVTGVSMSIPAHPYATSAEVVHMLTQGEWGYRVSFGNGHVSLGTTFIDNENGGHQAALSAACAYARRALVQLERQRQAREDLERQFRDRGGR